MKKLKIIAIISGILTAVQLFPALMLAVSLARFQIAEASSAGAVGIIGGADGPTAIYTTTIAAAPILVIARYIFLAACVLTFIVSIVLLIRNRNKRQ